MAQAFGCPNGTLITGGQKPTRRPNYNRSTPPLALATLICALLSFALHLQIADSSRNWEPESKGLDLGGRFKRENHAAGAQKPEAGDSRSEPEAGERVDAEWLQNFHAKMKRHGIDPEAEDAPNEDSGVEKGTKNELPKLNKSTSAAGDEPNASTRPPNKEGVVRPHAHPSSRAAHLPVAHSTSGPRATTTTESPKKLAEEVKAGDKDQPEVAELEAEEAADSRASLEAVQSIVAAKPPGLPDGQSQRVQRTTVAPDAVTSGLDQLVPRSANESAKIEALGAKSIRVLGGKHNTSIMINGRKFDQVKPVECVDEKFFQILTDDLALIKPGARRDFYGSYYDYEYAKAIGAIVDTPAVKSSGQVAAAAEESYMAPSTGNKTIAASRDILQSVRKFWNETRATYARRKSQLGPNFLALLSRRLISKRQVHSSSRLPQHQAALDNYRYLQERLEQLKLMLMNGEEALVVLNNRVRKLNQVASEADLHAGLCSCITSRAGRSAMTLMNELFVDKDSAKLMENLNEAKRRGEETALDAAEFCAYWYGDTIRSMAVQKEKQIKRLVLQVAKTKRKKTLVKHTKKITETTIIQDGNSTKLEKRTRIVTNIVQMTELWMPKLANWIKETLDLKNSTTNEKVESRELKPGEKLAPEDAVDDTSGSNSTSSAANSTSTTTTTTTTSTKAPTGRRRLPRRRKRTTTKAPEAEGQSEGRRRRKRSSRSVLDSENIYSNPFDHESYADLEEPLIPAGVEGTVYHFYLGNLKPIKADQRQPSRVRRAAASTTTRRPLVPKITLISDQKKRKRATERPLIITTTSRAPQSNATTKEPEENKKKETQFEERISEKSRTCAISGFAELLSIAFDQNSLLYETNKIKRDDPYIEKVRESFEATFARSWLEKRNKWSKSMSSEGGAKKNVTGGGEKQKPEVGPKTKGRSVDEEIDDSFDLVGGSYERGARLGFTVGRFIGDKAAKQWPDPAELNTFTYDSLFLAGVALGYSERDSRLLERRIVAEAAKRVAFTEANRQAFAKTLHSSYLNGAFIIPLWGVLHAQRAVAKQAAREGARAGFESAARAAQEFVPKAKKFFDTHKHQRQLAAPYKAQRRLSDKWAGLSEHIEELRVESELSRNISQAAIDCGHKSGTLMGAVMGLVVTPEAFETYTKFRGSLEALESEFNQYKLGAMRGYELGEAWAYLNYTATMNNNLKDMKAHMLKNDEELSKLAANATSGVALRKKQDNSSGLSEAKGANSTSTPRADNVTSALDLNTNNLFQFMVLNYGTHLVANHSRKHMLRFRAQSMDESLLRDMKIQAGDLIAEPDKHPLSTDSQIKNLTKSGAAAQATGSDEAGGDDDLFETGQYSGELIGEFNFRDGRHKKGVKFNILDLGPRLELSDQVAEAGELKANGSSQSNSTTGGKSLETTPLTAALDQVNRMFLKFGVARRKKPEDEGARDEVARYLNGPHFDEGDGYLAGSFNKLNGKLRDGDSGNGTRGPEDPTSSSRLQDDDFGTEATILDELFERIERAPADVPTVGLVEGVTKLTTMAPQRIESIGRMTSTRRTQALGPLATRKAKVTKITIRPTGGSYLVPAKSADRGRRKNHRAKKPNNNNSTSTTS